MTDTLFSISDSAVAQQLISGAVGVLPTDTVYGIVCRADDPIAVARLYELKHREHKPGTVIAADVDQLVELGLKRRYLTPVMQYWPGAVSVVIPSWHELEYLHQGVQSLAVRIPAIPSIQDLLRQTGPLLTSSANHPGQPPAVNVPQAQDYFGTTVDFYVDGGDVSANKPSTIIRIVDDAVEVLRSGAVTIN
ncbi:MAG TPA: L-threonylcarbamoyladenylate synthase [Candidatus Saccharimonadales bacterium]|jgi:L-threonylcarbamoyladenylate synthase